MQLRDQFQDRLIRDKDQCLDRLIRAQDPHQDSLIQARNHCQVNQQNDKYNNNTSFNL